MEFKFGNQPRNVRVFKRTDSWFIPVICIILGIFIILISLFLPKSFDESFRYGRFVAFVASFVFLGIGIYLTYFKLYGIPPKWIRAIFLFIMFAVLFFSFNSVGYKDYVKGELSFSDGLLIVLIDLLFFFAIVYIIYWAIKDKSKIKFR